MKIYILLLTFIISVGCSSQKKGKLIKTVKKETKALVSGPRNTSNNTMFFDASDKYGLEGVQATHLYSVNLNNDFYNDLVYLPSFYSIPVFLLFDASLQKFVKMKRSPFGQKIRASYLNFADFDKDGVIDVILGTFNQRTELSKHPLRMFKGEMISGNISFDEVENAFPKLVQPTSSITVIDYDLDGLLDIYLGNWFKITKKSQSAPDRLFKGYGVKFKDVSYLLKNELKYSKSIGLHPNARPTFGTSSCDMDLNGYPDILTSSSNHFSNKLWMNIQGSESSRELVNFARESNFDSDDEGRLIARGGGHSFFSSCFDYNNDGIFDVLLGELRYFYDQENVDRSSILTGSTRKFPPGFIRTEILPSTPGENFSEAHRRGIWVDINNDGLADIILENSGFPPNSRLRVFKQHKDHSFETIGEESGIDILNPAGVIYSDANNDGKMDLIVGQSNIRNDNFKSKVYYLENRFQEENSFIKIYLEGEKSNIEGIGARVVLKSNLGERMVWHEPTRGAQASSNDSFIHYGIRKDEVVSYIKVFWPVLINGEQLVKKYYFQSIFPKEGKMFTICENGKIRFGRKSCKN